MLAVHTSVVEPLPHQITAVYESMLPRQPLRFRDGVHVADVSDLIRRMVKENLLKFDGKPLFPERIAYTVPYRLSDAEACLYAAVTDYVREEFNRAEALENDRRAGTVGFALTILQRRLASSPAAGSRTCWKSVPLRTTPWTQAACSASERTCCGRKRAVCSRTTSSPSSAKRFSASAAPQGSCHGALMFGSLAPNVMNRMSWNSPSPCSG